jgi:Methyltransferase domain
VTAWRLPGGETVTPDRPWMNLEDQPGFRQRAAMVAGLASLILAIDPAVVTVIDLGCGDGSLLSRVTLPPFVRAWGYELGSGDVAYARTHGRDVRQADILNDPVEYGDLIIVSEVLEHLEDPTAFLKALPPDGLLIASSPSAEHPGWFNPIHSWAFDLAGYRELLEGAGWRVLYQMECDGGLNEFGGAEGVQRFQAAVAVR